MFFSRVKPGDEELDKPNSTPGGKKKKERKHKKKTLDRWQSSTCDQKSKGNVEDYSVLEFRRASGSPRNLGES